MSKEITKNIKKYNQFINEQDMRDVAKGVITGGENVNIDIKQLDSGRKYAVYVNDIYIGEIYNNINYHNSYVSNLLKTDAYNLAKKHNLIPTDNATRIQFIGDISHVKNG